MQSSINPFIQPTTALPTDIQTAIDAINLPDVQEMLKNLSKYNLGICVPHKHNEEMGDFQVLPSGTLQLENDLQVSFINADTASAIKAVPVSWRWDTNGVVAAAVCVTGCTYIEHQGNEAHRKWHKKVE